MARRTTTTTQEGEGDKTTASIRDRVVAFQRVPASELLPNPKNWRMHNDAQRRVFREMLDRVGFAGAELVRTLSDGRLMLIDGHMRQEEMGDTPIPVLVTDLSEHEADALLATFDPLGRLAGTDQDAAAALIESLGMAGYDAAAELLRVVADNDQTAALLESLADGMIGDGDETPDFDPASEDEQGRLDQKAPVTCPHCGHTFVPQA